MANPNMVMAGYSFSLYCQATSGSPLTVAQLGTKANVEGICGTAATPTTANQLKVESVPAFGFEDASATYTVAGSRFSDKIVVQSAPTSMTVTAAWNPSDSLINDATGIRGDAESGLLERTYVIVCTDNLTSSTANRKYFAFNARVGGFSIDGQPGAEAKCIFTIHPRGGQFGWSNS